MSQSLLPFSWTMKSWALICLQVVFSTTLLLKYFICQKNELHSTDLIALTFSFWYCFFSRSRLAEQVCIMWKSNVDTFLLFTQFNFLQASSTLKLLTGVETECEIPCQFRSMTSSVMSHIKRLVKSEPVESRINYFITTMKSLFMYILILSCIAITRPCCDDYLKMSKSHLAA